MYGPGQNSEFCFSKSPDVYQDFVLGNLRDFREKKTNWFPEGPYIKCFVIHLNFPFKRSHSKNKESTTSSFTVINPTGLSIFCT